VGKRGPAPAKEANVSIVLWLGKAGRSRRHCPAAGTPSGCTSWLQVGSEFVFTVRDPSSCSGNVISVSYESFIEDILVRPGMPESAWRIGGRSCRCPSNAFKQGIAAMSCNALLLLRLESCQPFCLPERS
jgi:hypothetical protein